MRLFHAVGLALLASIVASPAVALVQQAQRSKENLWIERGAVSPRSVVVDPASAGPSALAAGDFLERHGGQWTFRVDPRTNRADLVQGSGIPALPGAGNSLGSEAVDLEDGQLTLDVVSRIAAEFVQRNPLLVAPQYGLLVPDHDTSSIREDGRLISIYFRWEVDGVPVEGASVFVRFNSGNITQFGAPLVGPIDVSTAPVLSEHVAWRHLLAYSGDEEVGKPHASKLILQPEEGPGATLRYRLVWKLTYRVFAQLETWEGRVDAATGEIVGFRDTNAYMNVVGGVYPRTVLDNDETRAPMPFSEVWLGNSVVLTDAAGGFAYSGGEIQAGMTGRFHRSSCKSCSGPSQPYFQQSSGSGFVDFGAGGLDEIANGVSTPADRNTYFHLNQVQRIALKWLPAEPWFSRLYFTGNVNIQASCNAVFSGDAINMFRSSNNCNNTGEIADIVYHEYGHGMDLFTQPGDGATGEASGDIVSMHMTHSPLVGPGFNKNGNPVRNIDQFTTGKGILTVANIGSKCNGGGGPLGFEVHCEGEIYGQTSWDLAQALVTKHGHFTGWRTSERLFQTSLPDVSGYLPSAGLPAYDAYLNADDDDGNLANGTPNAQEIFDAFDAHGIAGAAVASSAACARPAQPALSVTPQCDQFDLSWTAVGSADHYEVFRTELREDMAAFPLGEVPSGTTTFTDSEVVPGVDYWYTVMAVDSSDCESLVESPVFAQLTAQPILTVAAAGPDDVPKGNRSGFADPGEDVDVVVSLANFGEVGATGVSGTVVPLTAGVTMLEDVSSWPALSVGQIEINSDPIRFQTDDGQVDCGDMIRLQFDPTETSGCSAADSFIDVRVGEGVDLHFDDFESNLGWMPDDVNSTATGGAWTRGVPDATDYQPGTDATPDGVECWFTAPGSSGTGDVDNGVQILISPLFDLSGESNVEYSYSRWYSNSEPEADTDDFFSAEVSDDAGSSWVTLELLDHTHTAANWMRQRHLLDDVITLTNQVMFRFQVADGVADGEVVEAAIDDIRLERFECDLTPACFIEPTFSGLQGAAAGTSCGEVDLSWSLASTNCTNATISYNVYRSTDPGFVPSVATLIAEGVGSTGFTDILLTPGATMHYIVRAYDSRSGEDSNTLRLTATPPGLPDIRGPVFGGLDAALPGDICGESLLSWSPGLESCSGPVEYDIYRSTNPLFVPAPADLVGTTLGLTFTDLTAIGGTEYTYVVRARDSLGNTDLNLARVTNTAKALDKPLVATGFETNNGGWSVVAPDTATAGNWEWGDPFGTAYQPEDDNSDPGVNCWITGRLPVPSNGDVDGGTTTLLSAQYNLAPAVNPGVRYDRWFTNDRGSSPGQSTDDLIVEISNDNGGSWAELERVGIGTPLEWVSVESGLPIAATNQMRFRFQTADLGEGSLVEAGVDNFELIDIGQGCQASLCGFVPNNSNVITEVQRSGNDIVLHWVTATQANRRVNVYHVTDCNEWIQIGSSTGSTFVHEDALLTAESFNYRITYIAPCGEETDIDAGTTRTCP